MKRILLVLLILILIGSGAAYVWLHSLTKKIFVARSNASPAITNSLQESLDEKKPINVLLLGYGGGNHDGAYLTDSIIAVHVDPKTQKVFLISIPRDTWVKIPTNGTDGSYSKINAAYQDGIDDTSYPNKQAQFTGPDGGGRLAEYMITQVTGIPFDYFVGMDFSGFTHTIDTLDGVDLTVQKTFDDYQYPIEGQEDTTCGLSSDQIASFSAQLASPSATISEQEAFPCRYEHLHFDQGQQHMNGTTALKYVRSRHSLQDGTDFGRAQRQRNLIVAVKQKLFSPTFIPHIVPFMSSLGDDLRTDLAIDDVKTLLQNSNVLNKYQIVSLALTDQNYLTESVSSDGQDILASKNGNGNWTSVHTWLTNAFNGKSQPIDAVIQVQNGTTTAGLAQTVTDKLKSANLHVVAPGNATTHDNKKTTITVSDNHVNPATLVTLKKDFGVKTVTTTTAPQTNYNVLIVLGDDYSANKK